MIKYKRFVNHWQMAMQVLHYICAKYCIQVSYGQIKEDIGKTLRLLCNRRQAS